MPGVINRDDELRKQLPKAEGLERLEAMLADRIQQAKDNPSAGSKECIRYCNNKLEALVLADCSAEPYEVLYWDPRGRPAPPAVRAALEAKFPDHFTDVGLRELRLRNPGFGLFAPAQVNRSLEDVYDSLMLHKKKPLPPTFRP